MSYDDSFISDGIWISPSAIDRDLEIEMEREWEKCESYKKHLEEVKLEEIEKTRLEKLLYWQKLCGEDYHDLNSFNLLKIKKNFLSKIAPLEKKQDLEKVFLNEVFKEMLGIYVLKYQKEESLPSELVELAKNKNCLNMLIKGVFKKHALIDLEDRIIGKIEQHINEQNTTFSSLIVYDKVGKLQKFIHKIADEFYQPKAHKLIPSHIMKKTLSTARLYFSLQDMKNMSIEDLLKKDAEGCERASHEKSSNTDTRVIKSKKLIKNWKVRHYLSLWRMAELRRINEIFKGYLRDTNWVLQKIYNLQVDLKDSDKEMLPYVGALIHKIEPENEVSLGLKEYKVALTNVFISSILFIRENR